MFQSNCGKHEETQATKSEICYILIFQNSKPDRFLPIFIFEKLSVKPSATRLHRIGVIAWTEMFISLSIIIIHKKYIFIYTTLMEGNIAAETVTWTL